MNLTRRTLLQAGAAGALSSTLYGCIATNPATGRSSFTGAYSVEDDIKLGKTEHPKLVEAFGGEYANGRLQRYVDGIGRKLARHTEFQQFPYQFTLLNTPIVNAFALPGGFVYASRGLLALASNEAELAGVLAHELGHVNARHTAERLSATQAAQVAVGLGAILAAAAGLPAGNVAQMGQSIAMLSIQSYSRSQEFEADTLGVRYMSKADYDPDAMVSFLSTLREQSQVEAKALGLPPGSVDQFNMLSTHPRTIDRVVAATENANVRRTKTMRSGRKTYLRQIDGMLFGDDPSQGIVFGNTFTHPPLRFRFDVPEGYRIQNDPQQVVAQSRAGHALVFDMGRRQGRQGLDQYIVQSWAPKAKLRDFRSYRLQGMPVTTAWAPARTRRGDVVVRFAAIAGDDNSVYRFMMVSPNAAAKAGERDLSQTVGRFRRLTKREAESIKPLTLKVRSVAKGDTIELLSRGFPYGAENPTWFRVFNDMGPKQRLQAGRAVKVVST
jgi:predicted Zn-dependent protease